MRKLVPLVILTILLNFPLSVLAKEPQKEIVITLEAIQKDIQKNNNILMLSYKWSSLHYQAKATKDILDDLTVPSVQTAPMLPTDFSYFLSFYPDYNDLAEEEQEQIKQIILTQIQINYSLNVMIDADNRQAIAERDAYLDQISKQRKQLRDLIDELDTQKKITSIQEQEAMVGVKLYIEKLFVTILSLKEQVALNNLELKELNEELDRYMKLKELGLVTEHTMLELKKQISTVERKQKQTVEQYELHLTQLLIDLNYDLDRNYQIKGMIIPTIKEIRQPTDHSINNMITNIYSMKIMNENVSFADSQHRNSSGNVKEQAYYHLKMLQEQRMSLQKDLKKNVYIKYQTYREIYDDYQITKDVYHSLQMERDYIDKQFRLGIISELDKKKSDHKLEKIKLELAIKENDLFIGKKEEEALILGYLN